VTLTGLLPPGVTGKDVIVALCGLFNNDEVLNHAIEFTGSEQTMKSIPVDDRLAIANMTTEWGALSGLFPIDSVLQSWLRAKATISAMFPDQAGKGQFTHEKIDDLVQNQLTADPGATYAKSLYLNLSTLAPFVAGPNSVKTATPLKDLEAKNIKLDKAYLVSCTNSRASDIEAAARVFREAATDGVIPKVADGVKFYIAAASIVEQRLAEEAGDWQVLLDAGAEPLPSGCGPCIGLGTGLLEPGENGISASNRNFKGRMGSTDAKAYLASPEVVAASALKGKIAGPGWYLKPEGVEKVIIGEGNGDHEQDKALSVEEALDKLIADAESIIAKAEQESGAAKDAAAPAAAEEESLTEILPGFPEKVEGEIVFCDADNINTDGIYPGKCMCNHSPLFLTQPPAGNLTYSTQIPTKTTSQSTRWPRSAWRTTTRHLAASPAQATSSSPASTLAAAARASRPPQPSWPRRSRSSSPAALATSSAATVSTMPSWASRCRAWCSGSARRLAIRRSRGGRGGSSCGMSVAAR